MADHARTPPPGFDDMPVEDQPVEDQIECVQSLWDRIAADPDRVSVPRWHLDELRRRESSGESAKTSTWGEVRERILRRGRDTE